MMNKRAWSITLGSVSLFCSTCFWLELALRLFFHFSGLNLRANIVFTVWIVALGLALVAALIGSKRWILAAVVPIANFALFFLIVNLNE